MPTITEIQTDLIEYANFEEVGSVSRARLFVTAAKRWLILRAESSSNQSSSMSIGKAHVENLLTRAHAYISANASTGQTRFLHFGSFSRG